MLLPPGHRLAGGAGTAGPRHVTVTATAAAAAAVVTEPERAAPPSARRHHVGQGPHRDLPLADVSVRRAGPGPGVRAAAGLWLVPRAPPRGRVSAGASGPFPGLRRGGSSLGSSSRSAAAAGALRPQGGGRPSGFCVKHFGKRLEAAVRASLQVRLSGWKSAPPAVRGPLQGPVPGGKQLRGRRGGDQGGPVFEITQLHKPLF